MENSTGAKESSTIGTGHSTLSSAWQVWASRALTLIFLIGSFSVALEPLLSKAPWMIYEEDDFFYYLKVAQNLAHGAGSTYNGLVTTNGYHPLWFLILTLLSWCTVNSKIILGFVTLSAFLATAVTYALSRQLISSTGIGKLAATALAVYVAIYSSHIYYGGMEVLLTVPLVLYVAIAIQRTDFWLRGLPQSAAFGLLLSVLVLSRLDTAILVAMLFISCLLHRSIRVRLRGPNIFGLFIGFVPVFIYFLSNRFLFGTWLPVSGMAKQLRFSHVPSVLPWQFAINKPVDQLLNYLPTVLAICLLPFLYKRLTPMQQVVFPVLLLFPFVYILELSITSDWGLFNWYYYPFRIAMCVAFVLFCTWRPTAGVIRSPYLAVPLALFVALLVFRAHRNNDPNSDFIYRAGVDVHDFSVTHPGVYAMGDYAGKVGYLLPYPLVQTEGLMMDRNFLSSIQRQLPLREALAPYHVRYYVINTKPYSGCYHADEPADAGPSAPHMRDVLCQSPVATFHYPGHVAYIFDLQQQASPVLEQR